MESAGGASAAETSSESVTTAAAGNGAPPPAHFTFSTRDVPPEDSFEIWRDLWMRLIEVEADLLPEPEKSFDATVDMWQAGPISIANVNSWNVFYRRTAALARNGHDFLSFTLCRRNMSVGLMQGDSVRIRPGGGFFLAGDRRFTVQPSNGCYSSLLRIDRDALLELLPRLPQGQGRTAFQGRRRTCPRRRRHQRRRQSGLPNPRAQREWAGRR